MQSGLKSSSGTFGALSVGSLHELTEVFDLFLREANRDGAIVNPICESLVELILLKVKQLRLPEGKAMSQAHATYERIRTYIDQQYLQIENIQQVARECGVTTVHVSRLFARFSDCGAYQYLVRRKMNDAAGLLMNEGLLVKEVAYKMGFSDPFQFSRTFKRVYGISPGQLSASVE